MAVKKKSDNEEFLVLGHLIKYNLYLLAKAVVFSAVCSKAKDLHTAVVDTDRIMEDLDLDTKARKQKET